MLMDITLPSVMLSKYGLAPSKQRGQNFLNDMNVIRKIVDEIAPEPDDVIIEIGPGFGALTFELAGRARHVIAVELDGGIVRAFREEYGEDPRITLVEGDILRFDFQRILEIHKCERLLVVGNIPYSITSPLIRMLTDMKGVVKRAALMVQSEVGDRIVARHGDRDYSGFSVVVQYHAQARLLFTVRSSCFFPRPKVDSKLVELDFERASQRDTSAEIFEAVVQAAFGKRRKMLRRSLDDLLVHHGMTSDELETATGVDLTRRGETLDVLEFEAIATALEARGTGTRTTVS